MKKLAVVIILIFVFCVSGFSFSEETIETKESIKDDAGKNLKLKLNNKFKNSIGMEFVYIERGKFMMGSAESADELAKKYELPKELFEGEKQHEVELTKGFYMQTTEVTVGQFRKFVEAEKYKTEAEKGDGAWIIKDREPVKDKEGNWRNPGFKQDDNHPVTCVSWNDAKAFCKWLNDNEKDGKGTYRLPTEAEWEYACRAGGKGVFQWGDNPDDGKGWCNVADLNFMGEFFKGEDLESCKELYFNFEDGYVYTSPVGKFKANTWGLYDMTGNVTEWCEDWHEEGFYDRAEAKKDPLNETFGDEECRVVRGGSYGDAPVYCRSAYRNSSEPSNRYHNVGFRVVRSASRE